MSKILVVGAGYGGLTAAALVAKQGHEVTVLERHTAVGGCASHFRRGQFSFDVGATTLSGLLPHQPIGRLMSSLGIEFKTRKLEPGMVIVMDGERIVRWADPNRWIDACAQHFGQAEKMRSFWQALYTMEQRVWALTKDPSLPPSDLRDLLRLAHPRNLSGALLLPWLLRSCRALMAKHGLGSNERFVRFVNEQLIISTQNYCDLAPAVTAAMGLCYPSETYYPYGGMVEPARDLAAFVRSNGGTIILREEVTSIARDSTGFTVRTAKGNLYQSETLISNASVWNMSKMLNQDSQARFPKLTKKYSNAWGACTVYFAIQSDVQLPTAYYQVHVRTPIPFCKSSSLFFSFSLDDDRKKAPVGWRTVTVSTHTIAQDWVGLSDQEYQERKEAVQAFIMKTFRETFPEFDGAPIGHCEAGTPRTFAHYTGRELGFVGGIPHSVRNSILTLPPNKTAIPGLYHVGDTAFPGQGSPAVILGGINVAQRIGAVV